MKKIITGLILTGFLALPVIGLAQGTAPIVPTDSSAVFQTASTVVNWAFWILLFAAAIVIIVSAYTFLTAAGDPDKTKTARNLVLYAVIAVIVGFLAKAVISLVASNMIVDIINTPS